VVTDVDAAHFVDYSSQPHKISHVHDSIVTARRRGEATLSSDVPTPSEFDSKCRKGAWPD